MASAQTQAVAAAGGGRRGGRVDGRAGAAIVVAMIGLSGCATAVRTALAAPQVSADATPQELIWGAMRLTPSASAAVDAMLAS
jgi:hypothetical protein